MHQRVLAHDAPLSGEVDEGWGLRVVEVPVQAVLALLVQRGWGAPSASPPAPESQCPYGSKTRRDTRRAPRFSGVATRPPWIPPIACVAPCCGAQCGLGWRVILRPA